MYEFIPDELKAVNNWVAWKAIKSETSHSGISKIPIDPNTMRNAKSNDPSTWADFDTALKASKQFSGLGFMFSNSGFFGIDIDDISSEIERYKMGDKNNIVYEFIETLESYTEFSQSGSGIHIICRGELPEGTRRKGNIEMYDSGRFFVMTGNIAAPYIDVLDSSDKIKPLFDKYLSKAKKEDSAPIEVKTSSEPNNYNLNLSEREIIEKALKSKQGDKFNALLHGDISSYNSHSEADIAFCNMLAFWTGCDAAKMNSIFRSSGLMRDKWNRKQSGTTYGNIIIEKAISDCKETYKPNNAQRSTENYAITLSNKRLAKLYSLDDTGNADRFTELYGDMFKYVFTEKKWLFYNGNKWTYDNQGLIFNYVDDLLFHMKKEQELWAKYEDGVFESDFEKHLKRTRSNKSKKYIVDEAKHRLSELINNFDKNPMLVNFKNGTLDLTTREFSKHKKEDLLTKQINGEYKKDAKEPKTWLKFLDDTFKNKELIDYLQKMIGYSISGLTSEQCIFFLYGEGRNGKSTFLEVLRDIIGDYSSNIQADTILVKNKNGGANSDIARLKGARFVTSVEPNEGSRIDEGLLKQITGGDIITARKLYCEEFEYKPEFKIWLATNHKPIIRGNDTGIWRRIRLIPFIYTVDEKDVDQNLKAKILKERESIIKWAIDGFYKYKEEGGKTPECVNEAVKAYSKEMNTVERFIEECCDVQKEVHCKAFNLYKAYTTWAKGNNEYIMSNNRFGREISKTYTKVRTKKGLEYNGIGLNYDAMESYGYYEA